MTADNHKSQSLFPLTLVAVMNVLRFVIGWHFLYEGVTKIFIPGWTSAGYLEQSRWILSPVFHWMASNAAVLKVVDILNIAGLIAVGLCLCLGLMVRWAGVGGMLLLTLYYAANPPFIGTDFGVPLEGHYFIVNKNLVEMAALLAVTVFPGKLYPGIGRLFALFRRNPEPAAGQEPESDGEKREPIPYRRSWQPRRRAFAQIST